MSYSKLETLFFVQHDEESYTIYFKEAQAYAKYFRTLIYG